MPWIFVHLVRFLPALLSEVTNQGLAVYTVVLVKGIWTVFGLFKNKKVYNKKYFIRRDLIHKRSSILYRSCIVFSKLWQRSLTSLSYGGNYFSSKGLSWWPPKKKVLVTPEQSAKKTRPFTEAKTPSKVTLSSWTSTYGWFQSVWIFWS